MVVTKIPGDETWARWVKPGAPVYIAENAYNERHIPKAAKWLWHGNEYKCWWTDQLDRASKLAEYADGTCREELIQLKTQRERSTELSRKAAMDANFPCPIGLSYLPFQNVGIQYALERKNTLFGDQMGLGKTIESIGFINAQLRVEFTLIVCPNTIKINWKRELEKWLVREMKIEIADSQYLPDPTTCNIVIMNYETARKFCYKPSEKAKSAAIKKDQSKLAQLEDDVIKTRDQIEWYEGVNTERSKKLLESLNELEEKWINFAEKIENKQYDNPDYNEVFTKFPWDCLIVDECHRIKNSKALQSKAVFNLQAERKLYLTGTPIVNRPSELWTIVEQLDPDRWKNKWHYFHVRYCDGVVKGVNIQNLPELQQVLRETIMIRRLKKDVLTELPAKRRQVIEIEAKDIEDLLKQERTIYEQGEKKREELQAKLELAKVQDNEEEYRDAVRQLKDVVYAEFSQLAKIRAETAERKIPYVITHLESVLEQEDKVVFFAHHHTLVDAVMNHFEKIAVKIDGRVTNVEDRQKAVDDFQNESDVKLFVGSIQAAGVGITLTASSTVIFGELDWVPGNMHQAEDRLHRIGQKECVLVQMIVLSESIDAKIAHTIIQKIEIIEAALDTEVSPETEIVDSGDHVKVDRKQVEKLAPYVSEHAKAQILEGLSFLSTVCDGAMREDFAGFNKVDSSMGKQLAEQGWLSNKQALLGLKLCNKYRRQLHETVTEVIYAEIARIKAASEAESD